MTPFHTEHLRRGDGKVYAMLERYGGSKVLYSVFSQPYDPDTDTPTETELADWSKSMAAARYLANQQALRLGHIVMPRSAKGKRHVH